MDEIDTTNIYGVASTGEGRVAILMPPRGAITSQGALLLAAWLVAMAGVSIDDADAQFARTLAAVQST